ncbi:34161_t:CDS:2, partial [Gigaspora margarita]
STSNMNSYLANDHNLVEFQKNKKDKFGAPGSSGSQQSIIDMLDSEYDSGLEISE